MSKFEKSKYAVAVALFVGLVFAVLKYLPPGNKPRDYMFSGCLPEPGALARTFDLVAFGVAWGFIFLFYCLLTGAAVAAVYFVLVRAPIVSFVAVRNFIRKRREVAAGPKIPAGHGGVVFPGLSRKDYIKDMCMLHGRRFVSGKFVLFLVTVAVAAAVWLTLFVTSAPRLCLTDTSTTQFFHAIIMVFSLLLGGFSALAWSYAAGKYQVPLADYVSTHLRSASALLDDGYGYKSRTEHEKALFGDRHPYTCSSVYGTNFRVEPDYASHRLACRWRACALVHRNTVTLFFSNTHRGDDRTVYCAETYTFSTEYPGRAELFSLLHGKLQKLLEYGADLPADVAANGKVKF